MGDWVTNLAATTHLTSFGGIGVAVALLLILFLRIALPREERKRIRVPMYFLGANLATVAARAWLPLSEGADKIIAAAGVFFILACLARATFLIAVDWLFGRRLARPMPKIFQDIIQVFIYVAVAFVTLPMVGLEPSSILTTSALLTAVIGLSLQETLGNLFAGLAIQAQRPFEVGDFIQFDADDKLIGRVTEINWRATKVTTNDQVDVIVPNGTLAKVPIRNFSQPTRLSRRTVTVAAPYETAPHEVEAAILHGLRGCPGVADVPAPEVLVFNFADSGIEYWVRFFTDEYHRRDWVDGQVRRRIWYAFQREGISIPFPIRDVRSRDHVADAEQKAGASLEARKRALKKIDFLAGLPAEALEKLAHRVRVAMFTNDETIIEQGDEGDELFIVHRGEVAVLVGKNGNETEVARLGPGKFFGEMSLMTGERRTATVRAIGACRLFVVGHEEVRDILEAIPHFAEHISDVLARRQAQLVSRASDRPDAKDEAQQRSGVLLSKIKNFFSL